jgi:non-ribosomal peptide synthetase component E (peptide arylation enzyme)
VPDLNFSKGFLGSVATYGQALMLDSTDPERMCATIQNEKVTAAVWVPTMAARLLDFDRLKEFDLSSLKKNALRR